MSKFKYYLIPLIARDCQSYVIIPNRIVERFSPTRSSGVNIVDKSEQSLINTCANRKKKK